MLFTSRARALTASVSSATTDRYTYQSRMKNLAHFGRPFTDSKRVGVAKLKLAEVVLAKRLSLRHVKARFFAAVKIFVLAEQLAS